MFSNKGIFHNAFVLKKAYDSLWENFMAEQNLTRAEIDVLAFLANHPDQNTARDIVDYRQIAKSHVSKAVDSLTGRGFLRGEHGTDDRRCIHLHLTPAAAPVVRTILQIQDRFNEALLDGLSEDDLRQFEETAHRITQNAEKMLR